MIDKELLNKTVEEAITNTDLFIVEIKVNPGNSIVVELDSETGIDIDTCADITRKIESVFDREVEVLTADGRKFHGELTAVGEDDFTIEVEKKVKEPGAKRPTIIAEPITLKMSETKSVKYLINFK